MIEYLTHSSEFGKRVVKSDTLDFARFATPEQLSELLFRYSTRDLREIGHKAIAVQNVHRLAPIVGPEYAPPVLRSLAAALQNHGNDPNPATRDLPYDRTWREFQAMLGEIPKTWKQGRRDDTARNELVRTLREVSELDAGRAVIDLLKHGVSTDSGPPCPPAPGCVATLIAEALDFAGR